MTVDMSFEIPAEVLYKGQSSEYGYVLHTSSTDARRQAASDRRIMYGLDSNGVSYWLRQKELHLQTTHLEKLLTQAEKEAEMANTEDQEFTAVTIYLDDAEMDLVRQGACATLLRHKVQAELPAVVDIEQGDIYTYEDGNAYEIVELGHTEAIIRRLKGNVGGAAGTRIRERRSKIELDIASGRATLDLEDEDVDLYDLED